MKLIMLWLGNPIVYWMPLLGLTLIGVSAFFLKEAIQIKSLLTGEKPNTQPANP